MSFTCGALVIRTWYSKHLTWVKTYQFDTYQVNNGSDPWCEEQWAMSLMSGWSRLSLWLHIRTRQAVRAAGEGLFVQHIVGIPHTGHSSYLQITHPYITLSLHITTPLITDHTSQPLIPSAKVITIFTTNTNYTHWMQALLPIVGFDSL